MVPAGVAAQAQGEPIWYLLLLATIASAGRMVAGSFLYFVADKLEDRIFANGKKHFGLTHDDVEGFGKKLDAKHPVHSWFVLFGLSAVPFLPTFALSLACGFVKVRFVTFLTTNFLGSIVNGLFFLYIGYAGLEGAKLISQLDMIGQIVTIVVLALVLVAIIVWRMRHKKQSKR
jgi:membrane protein DedA with SNARE-associated domain